MYKRTSEKFEDDKTIIFNDQFIIFFYCLNDLPIIKHSIIFMDLVSLLEMFAL